MYASPLCTALHHGITFCVAAHAAHLQWPLVRALVCRGPVVVVLVCAAVLVALALQLLKVLAQEMLVALVGVWRSAQPLISINTSHFEVLGTFNIFLRSGTTADPTAVTSGEGALTDHPCGLLC